MAEIESKPKVVILCGSSRFVGQMAVCAWLLEKYECCITMGLHLLPYWYAGENTPSDHLAEHENVAEQMDELHLRKIDLADEIFVVDCHNYIGDSTRIEMEYAKSKNLPIRRFSEDMIGHEVLEIIQKFLEDHKRRDLDE